MDRRALILSALIAFIVVIPRLAGIYTTHIFDDAFITFRYSENLAQGRGLVYNLGVRTLGTTAPLFALLLAGMRRFGLPVPLASVLVGVASDGSGRTSSPLAILFFSGGSIMLGMGLFRRHTVLVHYLGGSRARWLEVVQVSTAVLAYGLAIASDFRSDPGERLAFHLLSILPFAFHFVVVWVPLIKAQERPVLPETPFA